MRSVAHTRARMRVIMSILIAVGLIACAFLWEKGVMTDLGTLERPSSYAFGINPAGQVVDASYSTSYVPTATNWKVKYGRSAPFGALEQRHATLDFRHFRLQRRFCVFPQLDERGVVRECLVAIARLLVQFAEPLVRRWKIGGQ